MDDIAISYDRQSRKVRQTAQGKADFWRKREIKNQGEATAHPGRPSKAPSWCWNANPFYFPLKLMEITSLFPNFYNNKTGFYGDKLKELSFCFGFFYKKPIIDYFSSH